MGRSRGDLPDPWALPAGQRVKYGNLGTRLGAFDPDTGIIWLAHGLTQAQRRATLAHESVHAERGDERCLTPELDCRQEATVRREAARRLIPLNLLVEALLWCSDDQELAEELWVDPDTVRARREGLTPAEVWWVEQQIAVKERGA